MQQQDADALNGITVSHTSGADHNLQQANIPLSAAAEHSMMGHQSFQAMHDSVHTPMDMAHGEPGELSTEVFSH
jgi:hypothetical protein